MDVTTVPISPDRRLVAPSSASTNSSALASASAETATVSPLSGVSVDMRSPVSLCGPFGLVGASIIDANFFRQWQAACRAKNAAARRQRGGLFRDPSGPALAILAI